MFFYIFSNEKCKLFTPKCILMPKKIKIIVPDFNIKVLLEHNVNASAMKKVFGIKPQNYEYRACNRQSEAKDVVRCYLWFVDSLNKTEPQLEMKSLEFKMRVWTMGNSRTKHIFHLFTTVRTFCQEPRKTCSVSKLLIITWTWFTQGNHFEPVSQMLWTEQKSRYIDKEVDSKCQTGNNFIIYFIATICLISPPFIVTDNLVLMHWGCFPVNND